jgi:signal transduction histidine kinase
MFLHDEIGQILTTLKMDLEVAESRLEESAFVLEKLSAAKDKALEALSFAKHLSGQLRPSTLETLGLLASIRSLVATVRETADFEVHFFTKGLPEWLESDKELTLYRIVQESLTNVLKHAGAREVFVTLTQRDGSVVLTVEDDGKGFDDEKLNASDPSETSPLGITIMRERTVHCDGSFRIESQPGKGTQVMVEIPI